MPAQLGGDFGGGATDLAEIRPPARRAGPRHNEPSGCKMRRGWVPGRSGTSASATSVARSPIAVARRAAPPRAHMRCMVLRRCAVATVAVQVLAVRGECRQRWCISAQRRRRCSPCAPRRHAHAVANLARAQRRRSWCSTGIDGTRSSAGRRRACGSSSNRRGSAAPRCRAAGVCTRRAHRISSSRSPEKDLGAMVLWVMLYS